MKINYLLMMLLTFLIVLNIFSWNCKDDEQNFIPNITGMDIDTRSTLPLSSSYDLPDQFYSTLSDLNIQLSDLYYPDKLLIAPPSVSVWEMDCGFSIDPTRLHWTDTIRHKATEVPKFAYMIIENIENSLSNNNGDQILREIIASQQMFNVRDEFIKSSFDKRYDIADDNAPLLNALETYYKLAPVEGQTVLPSASWSDIEDDYRQKIAHMPMNLRYAIAQTIYGLINAANMRNEAFTNSTIYTMAQWKNIYNKFQNDFNPYTKNIKDYAAPAVDYELLARAGQLAVRSIESLRIEFSKSSIYFNEDIEITGALGKIILSFEDKDNVWDVQNWDVKNTFLLVDVKGNDQYKGKVAATTEIYYPISVVLDLDGDDQYIPRSHWEIIDGLSTTGVTMQGAGIFGIAILDDAKGNDLYKGSSYCQGSGFFGVGILVDHGGSDIYKGYSHSQGSAEFGYGLLIDIGSSDDEYETLQRSQGYGGPRGIGWLIDNNGNDNYLAIADPLIFNWEREDSNFSGSQGFGFGLRAPPFFSGGLGAIIDLGGNDNYQSAVMSLGFGYFFGTGICYDKKGNDTYTCTHKYALGGATHQSVGVFVDGAGADSYSITGDDEAIAIGHDEGVAFHIDRGNENDTYTVDHIGNNVLGMARQTAFATFINEGGDDTYTVPGDCTQSIGISHDNSIDRMAGFATEYTYTIGLFFDLAGKNDVYNVSPSHIGNNKNWRQTTPSGRGWNSRTNYGYGYDSE